MDYTFKTISRKVLGDLHTPVSIYLKVRDVYPKSALLESSDFHGNENSLSYIALCPLASIGINNGECTAVFPDGKSEVTALTGTFNVAEAMNAFLKRFSIEGPDRKVCGLFGYTAFDAVRYFENIPVMEAHHEENDAPDMLYILYKYVLVFNHFKNELTLVELMQSGENSGLQEIETLIENRNYASYNFQATGPETSPVSGEEYKAMVREGIRHCLRGDVFQIVLSRRFEQPFKGDDFKVYRALRSINPSPYLFYFDFGGFRIFGSSPETHCKVASTRLQARLSARETLHWTDSVPKLCLPIRKRMPSMSCWLTLPVTTFRAMRMTYRSISTRKCSTTVMSFIWYRVSAVRSMQTAIRSRPI